MAVVPDPLGSAPVKPVLKGPLILAACECPGLATEDPVAMPARGSPCVEPVLVAVGEARPGVVLAVGGSRCICSSGAFRGRSESECCGSWRGFRAADRCPQS